MTDCTYTVIVEKDGDMHVSHCPDFDVTSQGKTAEEATANLNEAIALLRECADSAELARRSEHRGF